MISKSAIKEAEFEERETQSKKKKIYLLINLLLLFTF